MSSHCFMSQLKRNIKDWISFKYNGVNNISNKKEAWSIIWSMGRDTCIEGFSSIILSWSNNQLSDSFYSVRWLEKCIYLSRTNDLLIEHCFSDENRWKDNIQSKENRIRIALSFTNNEQFQDKNISHWWHYISWLISPTNQIKCQ